MKMRKILWPKAFVLLVILCLGVELSSCSREASSTENAAIDYDYQVYVRNAGDDTLTTCGYNCVTSSEDPTGLVRELYEAMKLVPNENQTSVIPSNVFISDLSLNGAKVLTIYFPNSYYEMENVDEILFRAAVVKTMVQVEGIEYVSFYVDGAPLKSSSGAYYGIMNSAYFVSDVEDSMENLSWVELTLYYSDPTGSTLIGEKSKLAYSESISIEQVVVEQLLAGPTTSSCIASLPSGVSVISVSTKDSVCYVNFDSSFLTVIADCTAQVTIYSIVNSLCELSNVKKVQIQVNGSSDYLYRETYFLMDSFEDDPTLVEDKVEAETETSS